MIRAAERLYGLYRWGITTSWSLLPSFPYGGMENRDSRFSRPRCSPETKASSELCRHELAHSWSGNLVTNATWRDFWLNEGFTTYLERRIQEEVYGRDYSEMLAILSMQDLKDEIAALGPDHIDDTHLFLILPAAIPTRE